MNCQEIELHLSGYLEKSLDAIRMKSIETHLNTCPFCRAELHTLSDCIRLVADLPILEPPSGFAQGVMAQAREIELEPRPWRRFFAAFKLTAPVQAAAVVLVGVLAVVLYQREPQVKDIAFTKPPQATPLEVQDKTTLDGMESTPVAAPKDSRSRGARREINTAAKTAPPSALQARQAPSAAGNLMKDEAITPQSPRSIEPEKASEKAVESGIVAPRRATIQAQEVSTGESLRSSADALGVGAAVGALSRSPFRASPFSSERALSPLSEPNPDFEFVVKRRSSERREQKQAANNDLRKRSDATAGATSVAEGSVASPGMPANQVVEIRWFTVAQQHYEQFKKELAAEAIIDSERSVAAKENDFGLKTPRELLIKVTILPSER